MSNLIPEVRVNKNGVPVTKHVLPQTSRSTSKNPIPSPAAMTSVALDNWNEVAPLVADHIDDQTDSPEIVMRRIEGLDAPLRRQVTDALLSGDEYSFYIALKTMEDRKEFFAPYIMGSLNFHRSLHLATFKDSVDSNHRDLIQRSAFSSLARRFSFEFFGQPQGEATPERIAFFKADILDEYFDFRHAYSFNFEKHAALQELVENIDLVEAALPAMAQVKTGIRLWRYDNKESTDATYLLVPELLAIARVVEERPESMDHFYKYSRMRGKFDAEDFVNMLDTDSPALFDGVL